MQTLTSVVGQIAFMLFPSKFIILFLIAYDLWDFLTVCSQAGGEEADNPQQQQIEHNDQET